MRAMRLWYLPLLCVAATTTVARAQDVLSPLDVRSVKLGGELGRRIDITVNNNLLVLDADRDFLTPFREKSSSDGYIGLGKLIDATVKFAAYTNDPRVAELKDHLITETLKTQEPDGYIGIIKPQQRVTGLWDVHEMGYLVWGLMTDYEYFGSPESLGAARRVADYIVSNWTKIPADWSQQTGVATNVAVTGLERTLLKLSRLTGDKSYLEFVVRQRRLPDWDLGIVVGRRPGIEGHIYAYMSRCLAQLELNRAQPDKRLLSQTERALQFMCTKTAA